MGISVPKIFFELTGAFLGGLYRGDSFNPERKFSSFDTDQTGIAHSRAFSKMSLVPCFLRQARSSKTSALVHCKIVIKVQLAFEEILQNKRLLKISKVPHFYIR